MQPSNANFRPFPQAMPEAVPSFLDRSDALSVDDYLCHICEEHCNLHGVQVSLQPSNDTFNFPFVSPVTQQPSTTSTVPMNVNVNTTHVPHIITNLGYGNSDLFQAHSVMSEMSHLASPDPQQIITKLKEEASKIRIKNLLQLQSDYKKDVEKLKGKHRMLLQNLNNAVASKKKELDAQYAMVLKNKLLADAWIHNAAVQCNEQVAIPSSSTHEQCMANPPMIQSYPSLNAGGDSLAQDPPLSGIPQQQLPPH